MNYLVDYRRTRKTVVEVKTAKKTFCGRRYLLFPNLTFVCMCVCLCVCLSSLFSPR